MKWEAVIFDWAGTTVDYGCFAPVQTFVEVFKEFGVEPTMEETRKPMGMLKWDHIKTMLGMNRIHREFVQIHGREPEDSDVDAMHDLFLDKLMKVLDQFAEPKEHVLETVEKLRRAGIRIGSTTGYTDEMMAIVTRVIPEIVRPPIFTDGTLMTDWKGIGVALKIRSARFCKR